MKTITELLTPKAGEMNDQFVKGAVEALESGGTWRGRRASAELRQARWAWADHRRESGLSERVAPLLTPPFANKKLAKAETPSWGLTLQHYVQRITPRLVVNACPHAGDCTKVCVLDNGHGMHGDVQLARKAKTSFLVRQPLAFSRLLGWELALAQLRTGPIFFRPNVNSDIRWDILLPDMVASSYTHFVTSYGYTKDPFVLDTDGWVTPNYRLAYSWNEHSAERLDEVIQFVLNGGSVAMVTSRRKGGAVSSWPDTYSPAAELLHQARDVVDADLTDEWMFEEGVIGDLSAKGKARRLIGRSGFVVEAT